MEQLLAWVASLPTWAIWLGTGVLALLLTNRSSVDAWAQANPRVAGIMKTARGLGLDPWIILQGLCLIFLGRLPKWVQSAVGPRVGKKPSVPPIAVFVLALIPVSLGGTIAAGSPALFGCSRDARPSSVMVESGKALAFNSAVVALVLLDQREADYLNSLETPTQAQIDAAAQRVQRLKAARLALEVAREWIQGDGSRDGEQAIRDAVVVLAEVAALLKSEGVDVPPEVEKALGLVEGAYL
jgi:hypothetical protein